MIFWDVDSESIEGNEIEGIVEINIDNVLNLLKDSVLEAIYSDIILLVSNMDL